ncbi:MAG: hypothetical protein K2K70_00635 [Lachnospiraceae bacterium]|nr:hypothetical protein [Lachnospiraceae bacterium]
MYNVDERIWRKYIKRNKRREYFNYRINQISNTVWRRAYIPVYKRYAGHKVLSFDETNKMIANAILDGRPFWAGRYGGTELGTIVQVINKELGIKNNLEVLFERLCNGAGFFPTHISYTEDFAEIMLSAYQHMDLHAVWPQFMEDYFINWQSHNSDLQLTLLGHLEPWNIKRYEDDFEGVRLWTTALKEKRVLIIHPFTDTIRRQYKERRCHIFDNLMPADRILPQFELVTLKAVQTIAGERDNRFTTWFEALDYMTEECRKLDFDVAIVGCGAYGFPLSCEIKKMGKTVIHLGGATQLMFGIMGKRWEEGLKGIANASWTRPGEHEMVRDGNTVEGGCYW